MVTVRANLDTRAMPKNVLITIPDDKCNREDFLEYIEKTLKLVLQSNMKVCYDVVEGKNDNFR